MAAFLDLQNFVSSTYKEQTVAKEKIQNKEFRCGNCTIENQDLRLS